MKKKIWKGILTRALKVANEMSMMSAERGQLMVVQMERHKYEEGISH